MDSQSAVPNLEGQTFMRLQNLITTEQTTDTFHQRATTIPSCTGKRCLGSLMQIPEKIKRENGLKPKELVIKEATEFLQEYYASIRKEGSEAHLKRKADVIEEIQAKGLYDLTEQELTYGARLSWRNASRCIGRIQWSNLHIFDARDAVTATDMYDAIISHLKYGTNNGNLRSAMTIFPPRANDSHDFRVWNIQLVRYAGYEQPDGSVIGDPANVEFTKICESYGWKGKGGMFDVLPLLLQANGEDPELFEIPSDLVLEVPISHPEYEWFEELKLRWYALPAVSCLLLDIGGVEFPACPFNGWYMVTEIGARDFGDENRYNLCKPVAQRMKLDTRTETTLWRDKAIVEINCAVMHSFLKHGVTLVDHHSTSNSFMQHLQNEQKLRGGCPADWVWVVPPISGSATKVFHQEMLNYKIKPSLEYQVDAWKIHRRKTPIKTKEGKFKDIAKMVRLSTELMAKALAKRIKATILYSTETGTSERYGKMLKKLLDLAFDAKIYCLENYDFNNLDYENLVFVVTSTFGNADPPHNGEEFDKHLRHRLHSYHVQNQELVYFTIFLQTDNINCCREDYNALNDYGTRILNVKYSVFALGSRVYGDNFCAFGRFIDASLHKMGAERICPLGEGDELCGQEESFKIWADNALRTACNTFSIDLNSDFKTTNTLLTTVPAWSESNYRLVHKEKKPIKPLIEALSKIHSKKIQSATVISVTSLQSTTSLHYTILVKLDKGNNSSLNYAAGDHLSIFPGNDPEIVDALLTKLTDGQSPDTPIQMEYLNNEKNWTVDNHIPPIFTLREAFSRFVDISTPPTPQFLQYLVNQAKDEKEKSHLEELAKGQDEYEDWKFYENPNILDVIDKFPSLQIQSTLLLSKLPRLKQRYYSISSSMAMFPNEIHITVGVVQYYTKSGKLCRGVCSNWLNSLKEGATIHCFTKAAPSFQMPSNNSIPIIMVGPGTGIAPFRSFWQQRAIEEDNSSNNFGDMVLYFGCRTPVKDDIYREELEDCVNKKVIKEVYKAYSRAPDEPKQYVQDILSQNGNEVLAMLLDDDGHIYVCGDVSMAAGVTRAIQNILIDYGQFSQEDALEMTKNLKKNGRYHEDIFGLTLRTAEVTEKNRRASQR
ncbi:uncharacterized protein TRIADDRAFT_31504 [Trichoplax adhaerens]|uniref:Nitric oxide synthase n=1 Tax=Trichoplax adhaerens TaxID=10228 RepID=B3S994_TRIAD|nr:hypothetical protein TRIADDRAFT_31504 [Trichoplax adhaerens]EDV20662.1 hypothetical protein TRIADDRAFT_31504 [Trichoplax adhaerens]|eukprot:XP_002116862.1 hypothetical protein TRIADDRAFT_31504 [Trichoplax adhaerens]